MKSGHFQPNLPLLSILLPCSKITQSLDGIVFAGITRDYSTLALPDFLNPVARPARNNDEVQHVQTLQDIECSWSGCEGAASLQ